jgi:hypothetical protein
MSFKLPIQVLQASMKLKDVSGNEFRLWSVLAYCHNDDTGRCNPSYEYLAEHANMSLSTVKSCIAHLEELGHISIDRTGRSNRYRLLFQKQETTKVSKSPEKREGRDSAIRGPKSGYQTAEIRLSESRDSAPISLSLSSPSERLLNPLLNDQTTGDRLPVEQLPVISTNKSSKPETKTTTLPDYQTTISSPDPKDKENPDPILDDLVLYWKKFTKKPFYIKSFSRIVQQEYSPEQIKTAIEWAFKKSNHWAKESPNWELGTKTFDIFNSEIFADNFGEIYSQCVAWYEKVAEGKATERAAKERDQLHEDQTYFLVKVWQEEMRNLKGLPVDPADFYSLLKSIPVDDIHTTMIYVDLDWKEYQFSDDGDIWQLVDLIRDSGDFLVQFETLFNMSECYSARCKEEAEFESDFDN